MVTLRFFAAVNPANIYLFKVNSKNTRRRSEICLKLTKKTRKQRHWRRSSFFIVKLEHISCHWRRSSVFIVNFEHISHLILVFLC